jgi:DNA-binding beta-propeller fold protein YncE
MEGARSTRAAAALAVAVLAIACEQTDAPDVPDGYQSELVADGMGAIWGIAVGPDDKVYAVDNDGGRIFRVEADGTKNKVVGDLTDPRGIAFTESGRMFVASGSEGAVYEIVNGKPKLLTNLDLNAFPTSIAARGNTLYVSNAGNGTIVRVDLDGDVRLELAGFSAPSGPHGLSFDESGNLHVVDRATGGVYGYDFERLPRLLAVVTAFGGTFTATGFDDRLFVTDVELGDLLRVGSNGGTTVFASGFSGNDSPPTIGPNGIAYDGPDKLYVADADSVFLISRVR